MRTREVVIVGIVLSARASGGDDVCFVRLGDLPGGSFASSAVGISADGRTVVGSSDSSSGYEAFVWRDGAMLGLGDLPEPPFYSDAVAVSADGRLIVGTGVGTSVRNPVLWTDGMISALPLPADWRGGADDVSEDGTIVLGSGRPSDSTTGIEFPNLWVNGVYVLIPTPPGIVAFAGSALSGDGSTVVGQAVTTTGRLRAFRWNGQMELLNGFKTATSSNATAVSRDGSVVVGNSFLTSQGEFRPVFWRGTTMTPIDPAGATGAESAYACSSDGRVIVGGGGIFAQAFVWTELEGARPVAEVLLNDFGIDIGPWQYFWDALAVSADGCTIIGSGVNPEGAAEGWLARIRHRCTHTDVNVDRATDLVDLALLLVHFGECDSDPSFLRAADIDRNGCVDLPDLAELLSEFGTACL